MYCITKKYEVQWWAIISIQYKRLAIYIKLNKPVLTLMDDTHNHKSQ